MPQLIFVNLPVADLAASTSFYGALGARQELKFSDETAACMVFSETIHVMLLTHEKWRRFTAKPIVDAKAASEVMIALSSESRAAVDGLADAAIAAGGKADPVPLQDYGFMYSRSYEDLDGHIFEAVWMDAAAVAEGPPQTAAA